MSDSKQSAGDTVTAYESDETLKNILGDVDLSEVLTEEKRAACQKILENAKDSFFDIAQADMDSINAILSDETLTGNYQELARKLFRPASNIKGQAEIFGFSLIRCISSYLLEYCDNHDAEHPITQKDFMIITQLVEALRKAFNDQIKDNGGDAESELVSIVEAARKIST